eukprot:4871884-Prymnesium_polylepis.1
MRILGVSYRVIKQGAAYRAKMEDSGKGWKLLKTAPHSDRVDCALIREWWHTEEASTEDNVNKQAVHVFHGFDNQAREPVLRDPLAACARRRHERVPGALPQVDAGGKAARALS